MKTTWANSENLEQKWLLADAEGKILGRFASEIAKKLMGKDKVVYTPFLDTGDYVVVVNAEKIAVTGKKMTDKIYYRHSGYLGGLKERTLAEMLDRKPEEVIRLAVKRMLPKNRLGRKMLSKLKIYTGSEHPHSSQTPVEAEF